MSDFEFQDTEEEFYCCMLNDTCYDPLSVRSLAIPKNVFNRHTIEKNFEMIGFDKEIIHPTIRQPFRYQDLYPNAKKRQKLREAYEKQMSEQGFHPTGWEVVPNYTVALQHYDIQHLLAEIRDFFADQDLDKLKIDVWDTAWKKMNYLRLNLQYHSANRLLFLNHESHFVEFLGEIIDLSYSPVLTTHNDVLITESSHDFHREILRTIRELTRKPEDCTFDQLMSKLLAESKSQSASGSVSIRRRNHVVGFLLRIYEANVMDLNILVLKLLNLSVVLKPMQTVEMGFILERMKETQDLAILEPVVLNNIVDILNNFVDIVDNNESREESLITLSFHAIPALTQILNAMVIRNNIYQKGEHVKYLGLALSIIYKLLCDVGEAAITWSYSPSLLSVIHDMVREIANNKMYAEEHWALIFKIANTMYKYAGTADSMSFKIYKLYDRLLQNLHGRLPNDIIDSFASVYGPLPKY